MAGFPDSYILVTDPQVTTPWTCAIPVVTGTWESPFVRMRKVVWDRGVPGPTDTTPRRADGMSPSNSNTQSDSNSALL